MPRIGELGIGIVDCFVNASPGADAPDVPIPRESFRDDESLASWPALDVVGYLFKLDERRLQESTDLNRVVENLDRWGIEKAQVPIRANSPPSVLESLARSSDRFFATIRLNPHNGMREIRALVDIVRAYPGLVKSVSLSPHMLYPQIAPNSKEYYPIFAKCVELALPVFINVGMPGPRVPGECQNPIYLDEVCWFFPDLKIVMRHGGEPWVDVCVKLMLKWPNLYYATTAFAPKYYPPQIVHYANTRGEDKIIYAGYWPLLSFERIFKEMEGVPFKEHVWPKFLRENAVRVFALDDR